MIIFAHLYNDYSGSPKVLYQTVKTVMLKNEIRVYVGSDSEGILDNLDFELKKYPYKRSTFRSLTFINYLYSQIVLFLKLYFDKSIEKNSIIYINTLLPFGAAIYGKLTRKRIIYHLHEVSLSPQLLKNLLKWICSSTATEVIYVSYYHQKALNISTSKSNVIYNSINLENTINKKRKISSEFFNVTILSSLKDYKGIPEFLNLSRTLTNIPKIRFHIVPNANDDEIFEYFKNYKIPENCKIHKKSENVYEHYQYSNLVMNLSRPSECVETFGLTLLEALSLGIPAIGPNVGGPTEIIQDGYNGFLINSHETEKLRNTILQVYNNTSLYDELSKNAIISATKFSHSIFEREIAKIIG